MRVQTCSNTRFKGDQTQDNYYLIRSVNELAAPGVPPEGLQAIVLRQNEQGDYYAEPLPPIDGRIVYGHGGSFIYSHDPDFPTRHPIPLLDRVVKVESY